MKFRNATADVLQVPYLGVSVEPGGTTPDLDDATAAGFVLQTSTWVAVGADAKQEQKTAVADAAAPSEGTV